MTSLVQPFPKSNFTDLIGKSSCAAVGNDDTHTHTHKRCSPTDERPTEVVQELLSAIIHVLMAGGSRAGRSFRYFFLLLLLLLLLVFFSLRGRSTVRPFQARGSSTAIQSPISYVCRADVKWATTDWVRYLSASTSADFVVLFLLAGFLVLSFSHLGFFLFRFGFVVLLSSCRRT